MSPTQQNQQSLNTHSQKFTSTHYLQQTFQKAPATRPFRTRSSCKTYPPQTKYTCVGIFRTSGRRCARARKHMRSASVWERAAVTLTQQTSTSKCPSHCRRNHHSHRNILPCARPHHTSFTSYLPTPPFSFLYRAPPPTPHR